MRFLSRFYALEANEDRVSLTRRENGAVLYAAPYASKEDGLHLLAALPDLDVEARRLLLQWAFKDQNTECLILPNPPRAEVLMAWAEQGARMDTNGFFVPAANFAAANKALGCKGASWLERELPVVQVACVALINDQDQVLLAQRPEGKSQAGLWELPGGKLEPKESAELALCREMAEELGIHIWNSCLAPLTFVSHAYETFHLTMFAYACYRWEGELRGLEGQAFAWHDVKDIEPAMMPAANVPLVHALQDLLG